MLNTMCEFPLETQPRDKHKQFRVHVHQSWRTPWRHLHWWRWTGKVWQGNDTRLLRWAKKKQEIPFVLFELKAKNLRKGWCSFIYSVVVQCITWAQWKISMALCDTEWMLWYHNLNLNCFFFKIGFPFWMKTFCCFTKVRSCRPGVEERWRAVHS